MSIHWRPEYRIFEESVRMRKFVAALSFTMNLKPSLATY